MFEYGGVVAGTEDARAALDGVLARVRARHGNAVLGTDATIERSIPAPPAIATLLPGGLRPGAVYSLDAPGALLLALLAEASRAGSWCGAVGIPELGAEAAERAGIDLDRLVLVPRPGERWLAAAAAVAEVLAVVALRPSGRVRDADAARLAARLRDRGAVLLTIGPWPQAEAMLSIDDSRWSGLGLGHGCLAEREVDVIATSRRSPAPRRVRVVLEGGTLRLAQGPGLRAVPERAQRDGGPALPMRRVAG